MSDDRLEAEQIKRCGWRQGSILRDELVAKLVAADELPNRSTEGHWVVISHDCDVTSASFEAEPRAELIFAETIRPEQKDGNKEWGKNPRLLQVSDPPDANIQEHIQFNAHHREWIPRQHLAADAPASRTLAPETVHRLAIWVTKRYVRSAFPDVFNERTRSAVGKLRKKFKKKGDLLTGVYLLVEDVEMATGEDYRIILCSVMRDTQFADQQNREDATKLHDSIEAELDNCDGVDVVQSELRSESQVSLAELRLLKRWDFDDLTLRDEDPDSIPKPA